MITVMDRIGFGIIRPLLKCGINKKNLVSLGAELVWSKTILSHGYNIAGLAIWWRNWDFRNEEATKRRCQEWNSFGKTNGDNYNPGSYDGGDFYPLEHVFFKTNRKIRDYEVAHLTKIY